jgi:hypothetical protein
MRPSPLFLVAVVLVACGPAPDKGGVPRTAGPIQGSAPGAQKAAPDEVVEFLLASAASDFRAHGPGGPLRFRDVRAGHVRSAAGEEDALICGQFLQTEKGSQAEWTPFVTLKTSGYEQYIGAQSSVWCDGSAVVWDGSGDLSSTLQGLIGSQR